jgi:hypothetical protein
VAEGLFAAGAVDEAAGIPDAITQMLGAVLKDTVAVFTLNAEEGILLLNDVDAVGGDGTGLGSLGLLAAVGTEIAVIGDLLAAIGTKHRSPPDVGVNDRGL